VKRERVQKQCKPPVKKPSANPAESLTQQAGQVHAMMLKPYLVVFGPAGAGLLSTSCSLASRPGTLGEKNKKYRDQTHCNTETSFLGREVHANTCPQWPARGRSRTRGKNDGNAEA
jgi:hypothetical protein